MTEKKKTILDWGLQLVRELLKEKPQAAGQNQEVAIKKAKLEDLSLDDLQREKIRMTQEERKMLARLKEVEKQKRVLFTEGVGNDSDREQRVIARRIKELDVEANNMDRMLQVISKQMRVLNGLMQLKERSRMAAESGLSNLISNIDLQDLILYIDRASVDGEFNMDKFDQVLNALEEADALSPEYREDQDVMDIVKAMQDAREQADSPEMIEKRYEEINRHLEEKAKTEVTDLESSEEEI
jgi:hypothetical protein